MSDQLDEIKQAIDGAREESRKSNDRTAWYQFDSWKATPERALNARVVSDQLHIGTTLRNPTNPPEHVMVTFMLDRQYLTSFVLWMTLSFSINMVCMLLMHTGHAAQGVPDDRLKIQIL